MVGKDTLYESKTVYFENLDALRFLAFFSVFIHHAINSLGYVSPNSTIQNIISNYGQFGDLGVNFFFVLSGFLITFLLIKEKNTFKLIKVEHFYVRRILRIWPLYFLVLFLCFIVVPYIWDGSVNPLHGGVQKINKGLYMFFFGNFDYVVNGISNNIVGILWSVSIEEQFYVFWPILMSIIPRKHLMKFFVVLIIWGTLYRLYGTSGRTISLMQKYHTLSCMTDLATGALFALLVGKEAFCRGIKNLNSYIIITLYIIGIALLFFRTTLYNMDISQQDYLKQINFYMPDGPPWPRPINQYFHAILPVVYSLFFGFVIVEQILSQRSIFKIGKIKVFTFLGKISYGLYVYHMFVMCLVAWGMSYFFELNVKKPNTFHFVLEVVASLLLTILISYLSFTFFESKFLRLKSKFNRKI